MQKYDTIFNRIDSVIDSHPAVKDFMDCFAIILQEVQQYESIDAEDIISYLRIQMSSCPLVKNQYYV